MLIIFLGAWNHFKYRVFFVNKTVRVHAYPDANWMQAENPQNFANSKTFNCKYDVQCHYTNGNELSQDVNVIYMLAQPAEKCPVTKQHSYQKLAAVNMEPHVADANPEYWDWAVSYKSKHAWITYWEDTPRDRKLDENRKGRIYTANG